jgi:putative membrane protein
LTEINARKEKAAILVSASATEEAEMSKRTRGVASLVAAIALVPAWAWAQPPSDAERYAYGPHMMWWGGGWYGMIFGPLLMSLVIAAVIALVLVFARVLGGPWHGSAPPYQTPPGRTPLDILKERFARGEIDKPEYEERRRVLGE